MFINTKTRFFYFLFFGCLGVIKDGHATESEKVRCIIEAQLDDASVGVLRRDVNNRIQDEGLKEIICRSKGNSLRPHIHMTIGYVYINPTTEEYNQTVINTQNNIINTVNNLLPLQDLTFYGKTVQLFGDEKKYIALTPGLGSKKHLIELRQQLNQLVFNGNLQDHPNSNGEFRPHISILNVENLLEIYNYNKEFVLGEIRNAYNIYMSYDNPCVNFKGLNHTNNTLALPITKMTFSTHKDNYQLFNGEIEERDLFQR